MPQATTGVKARNPSEERKKSNGARSFGAPHRSVGSPSGDVPYALKNGEPKAHQL
jgi:hypothetical protein